MDDLSVELEKIHVVQLKLFQKDAHLSLRRVHLFWHIKPALSTEVFVPIMRQYGWSLAGQGKLSIQRTSNMILIPVRKATYTDTFYRSHPPCQQLKAKFLDK